VEAAGWSRTVPGAGGSLAAQVVARASGDGYTLLVHSSGYAINAALSSVLPYERKDTRRRGAAREPGTGAGGESRVGLKSVAELIAAAKARPGEVTYGSAGIGSGAHFNAEKFRIAAGIDLCTSPTRAAPKRSTTRSPAAWSSRSTPSRSRCPTSAMAAWPSSA